MMRRMMLWTLLWPLFCAMFSLGAQAAPNCTYAADPKMAFGSLDILNYSSVATSAQIKVTCTGLGAGEIARVCLNFNGGYINNGARSMKSGTRYLNYFVNASAPPGFLSNTTFQGLVYLDVTQSAPSRNVQLAGSILSGQASRPVGYYTENITTDFYYGAYTGVSPIDCDVVKIGASSFSLLVDATITPNCSVVASPLTFPDVLFFTADVTGQSAVTVTCTTDAPYWVSLDNGQNAASGQRRMRAGAEYIAYDLYSDSARALRWGATKDVDTVSGIGVYTGKQHPVYGKIPKPAVTPLPGTYSDQIIATVNF